MRRHHGFTLAELLIVVAIIAVLVAISIPVFTGQLEKSKQAVDLANMRNAYAVAQTSFLTGEIEDGHYYYNGNGLAASKDGITGYGKSKADASTFSSSLPVAASGRPNDGTNANIITVYVGSEGVEKIVWGNSLSIWAGISGTKIDSASATWYGIDTASAIQKNAAFNAVKANSNEDRKAADKEILSALADFFNGKTKSEMQALLGSGRAGNNNTVIFEYALDSAQSIRINNIDVDMDYLFDIGYSARNYLSSTTSEVTGLKKTNGNDDKNYVDTFLFTSDEMIGDINSETKHQIKLKYNYDDDKVTNAEVYVSGLEGEGFTSNGT